MFCASLWEMTPPIVVLPHFAGGGTAAKRLFNVDLEDDERNGERKSFATVIAVSNEEDETLC